MNAHAKIIGIIILTPLIILTLLTTNTEAYFDFNDCEIIDLADYEDDETIAEGLQHVAYVTGQGHFSMDDTGSTHGLFCDERIVTHRTDNYPVFWYSDDYGMGHVSFNNDIMDFDQPAMLGFSEDSNCKIREDGCGPSPLEVCVVRVGNAEQSHVVDCNKDNYPIANSFQGHICCEVTEYCRDGIDNTGNDLIDCADPQCHGAEPPRFTEPRRCDIDEEVWQEGESFHQDTENCVLSFNRAENDLEVIEYDERCHTPVSDEYHYCSYGGIYDGEHDVLREDTGVGYCCPKGYYSMYNETTESWQCEEYTDYCGITEDTPCAYNFYVDNEDWITKRFTGNESDYCHTTIPRLRVMSPSGGKSEICCPEKGLGTADYFVLDKNIRIFGHN